MLPCSAMAPWRPVQATETPVAVGFGISRPEHVEQVPFGVSFCT
jgi:hypothetical protein